MTAEEKMNALYIAMEKDWGGELGEKLWRLSCQCRDEEEIAKLYDEYETQLKKHGLL